uniref:(northern house mosquito) hypothetical protein n=1 Tax=Culex pipiens TaxID=7175 RepID=A0A8D8B2I0_CULPI
MYTVTDFDDLTELRDLYYNQKETLFKIINDVKNFSAIMTIMRLRTGKFNWFVIEIILELIDKKIIKFSKLQDENVLLYLITVVMFGDISAQKRKLVKKSIRKAWGITQEVYSDGLERSRRSCT